MSKVIDLRKTVFELAEEHAEFVEIMKDLGFSEITKGAMLHSVGRIMTLPRGAKMKDIPMDRIIQAFTEKGFEIVGLDNEVNRTELIKSYLKRLGDGEALEAVKADIVREL